MTLAQDGDLFHIIGKGEEDGSQRVRGGKCRSCQAESLRGRLLHAAAPQPLSLVIDLDITGTVGLHHTVGKDKSTPYRLATIEGGEVLTHSSREDAGLHVTATDMEHAQGTGLAGRESAQLGIETVKPFVTGRKLQEVGLEVYGLGISRGGQFYGQRVGQSGRGKQPRREQEEEEEDTLHGATESVVAAWRESPASISRRRASCSLPVRIR